VHDEVDVLPSQDIRDRVLIAQIRLIKRDTGRDRLGVSENQVVQNDRFVACGDKLSHAMASDVTCPSDDENVHAVNGVLV
jgi:hypothetical protein